MIRNALLLSLLLAFPAWGQGFSDSIIFCGELADTGTFYAGPALGMWDGSGTTYPIGDATNCDPLGSGSRASAAAPLDAYRPFKATGMICISSVAPTNAAGIQIRLDDDGGTLLPGLECTIAQSETSCASQSTNVTPVVANSAMSIRTITAENMSTQDIWCRVGIAWME